MKRILAYGEILWDIFPDKTVLGGAPFNFAYRVNSLGDEANFVSSLGIDDLGDDALSQAHKLGMNTSLIQRCETHPTGTVNVSFDDNHMPDYVINTDVAYDHIQLTEELIDAAHSAECIAFGTLVQRGPKARETLYTLIDEATDAVKFYDINLRKKCYSKETILFSLEKANILKINDDEVELIRDLFEIEADSFPGFCEFVAHEFNLDYILITFGDKGAFAQSSFGEQVYVSGYHINLADSVGAGDAFSAAFIHKILSGESLRSACEFGNALGALVAATHGATVMVSQQEINNLLSSHLNRRVHPEFL